MRDMELERIAKRVYGPAAHLLLSADSAAVACGRGAFERYVVGVTGPDARHGLEAALVAMDRARAARESAEAV